MNNAILIQQIYPNTEGVKLLELTQARHQAYCDKWQIDYQCVYDKVFEHDEKLGSFAKIALIQQAILDGYTYIIWLDADTVIKNLKVDLRLGCVMGIGACWHRIPQLNHWNVGALYMIKTPAVKSFIEEWRGIYPPPKDGWNEQGVFNRLAMKSDVIQTISDRWNATLNYSMVPDAVVLGFHGYGTTQERYQAMQDALKSLETREGTR